MKLKHLFLKGMPQGKTLIERIRIFFVFDSLCFCLVSRENVETESSTKLLVGTKKEVITKKNSAGQYIRINPSVSPQCN